MMMPMQRTIFALNYLLVSMLVAACDPLVPADDAGTDAGEPDGQVAACGDEGQACGSGCCEGLRCNVAIDRCESCAQAGELCGAAGCCAGLTCDDADRCVAGLSAGDTCQPSANDCGPGLTCCYPCGIPDCDFVCEPTCAPGSPACSGGCLLRP
jgi:hypothetical protein